MAGYVIIGVHGLANKPPEETKVKWWHQALFEGLKRNCDKASDDLAFDFVYWADALHDAPLENEHNDQPYLEASGTGPLPAYERSKWDRLRSEMRGATGSVFDKTKEHFGLGKIADRLLAKKVKDLSAYYEREDVRTELRGRLREKLDKYRSKRIMLIAHSMGSIVAYDVLRQIGREDPSFALDYFITIGSPLGMPHVKYKIWQENNLVRTPSVVRKWTNFADRRDFVAVDPILANDYEANAQGVQVKDRLVLNEYVSRIGENNHHKSYGYLRVPELSETVRQFI